MRLRRYFLYALDRALLYIKSIRKSVIEKTIEITSTVAEFLSLNKVIVNDKKLEIFTAVVSFLSGKRKTQAQLDSEIDISIYEAKFLYLAKKLIIEKKADIVRYVVSLLSSVKEGNTPSDVLPSVSDASLLPSVKILKIDNVKIKAF